MNFKTGFHVYQGRVKATQGSTLLTGDIVTTQTDTSSKLTKITAYAKENSADTQDNLAHYKTTPKPGELPVDAKAEVIYYYPIEKKVILIGHALVIQGTNVYEGPRLTYYIQQQEVISEQGAQQAHAHFTIDTKTL
jgi:lipopolysaccharide export system protein LptA